MTALEIRRLTPSDADALSAMLTNSSSNYQRYFAPFPFDADFLKQMLAAARNDQFWGMSADAALAGMFMLRGFDEGYTVPSYGVSVAEKFSGRGLLKVSLAFSIAWCRLNDINRIRLTVHPDNVVAKNVYENIGFRCSSSEPGKHLVYFLALES